MTAQPLLEVRGLVSGYGGLRVLDGLSFTVAEGEFLAIVGPNGHGKTTLLKTISGLVAARQGTITFAGAPIANLRPDRVVATGLVHVPQGDLLFPDMSVRENLLMGAYVPAAASRAHARLAEVFAFLPKLRERQDQAAATLSGGERRMVGIGRGMMAAGKLLMLDEPSLGLAPILIDQIYALIDGLKAAGKTILLVEENPVRIFERADRACLLDNGRFVWTGSGPELMQRPEILETYLGH
jgi:branched-chain amino acid transport system ATP-binding protein